MSRPEGPQADRIDKVVAQLEERDLDALLVTGLVNVRWLCGFTGSNAALVVGRDGLLRFLTDFRYLTSGSARSPLTCSSSRCSAYRSEGSASTTPRCRSEPRRSWPGLCPTRSSSLRRAASSSGCA
jgi:Xaa-Pro aminopeptidase